MSDVFAKSILETNDNFKKRPNAAPQLSGSYNNEKPKFFDPFSRENIPVNVHAFTSRKASRGHRKYLVVWRLL